MADMNDGIDGLISKITALEKLTSKIEKESKGFSKNMQDAGKKGPSAAGGHKGVGGGNNVLGGSHGSNTSFDHGSMAGRDQIGAASFGANLAARAKAIVKGQPLVTGVATAMGMTRPNIGGWKPFGEGINQPSFVGTGPLSQADQAIVDRNQQIIDRSKSMYMGMRGVSMARFSALPPESQANITSSMYGPADTIKLLSGLTGAMGTFLPNVTNTMNRATSFYNAQTYNGNQLAGGAVDLRTATFNGLKGGMTGVGSDANVAQYLAARGMTGATGAGSTYQQTLRSIGNAGKYLNISNEEAAASIEGLTSAKGSAEMLRNFGIYTADLNTGKEKTQGQIFEELAQRLTAGRSGASVEETQASIRRGALGVTTDAFFQGDQQGAQMFKQYMIQRAAGGNKNMSAGWDQGMGMGANNENPLTSQYRVNEAQTNAMESAQAKYIEGITTASKVLNVLADAAGALAKHFAGGPNALLQTMFGNEQAKGLLQGVNTVVDFGSKAVSGIETALMGMDAFNPVPAIAEAGIIAGSAALSMGVALGAGTAGAAIMGGFGGAGGGVMATQGVAGAGGVGGAGGTFAFSMPQNTILQRLGASSSLYAQGTAKEGTHNGTDYAYGWNEEVKAIADGTVLKTSKGYKEGQQDETKTMSEGNWVAIYHPVGEKGYTSIYGHLNKVMVNDNDPVKKGQTIGLAGNTGYTRNTKGQTAKQVGDPHSGTHLHFEMHPGKVVTPGKSGQLSVETAANVLASGSINDVDQGTGTSFTPTPTPTPTPSGSSGSGYNGDTAGVNSALGRAGMTNLPNNAINRNPQSLSKGMNILKLIYSGDQAKILSGFQSLAAGVGVSGSIYDQYLKSGSQYVNLLPGDAGTKGGPGGSTNTNNVSINVTVPDVTAADAVKFAQLVKQYLDDNSLLSNTGRL
ncbi:Peptidase M23 [uncultured Caudovirales phage]|uniref:Peptidase M23 n=1 Tax=uncultured Caudovirales phage TaxID=2100421 RepID=A0A6J5L7I0_9CAUD|nr:Peptidase M23 [uncultured Caudovirales phage]CAB5219622.1 Peptidase M23 [uncultured Caudovirales phage]